MRRTLPTAVLLVAAAVLAQACTTSETLGTATAPASLPPAAEATAPPPPSTQAETNETAALPPPEGSAPAGAPVAANPAAPEPQALALAGSLARVQLAPVVGASVAAATPLSQRLESSGRGKGIDFRGEGAQRLSYVLKGYFSLETGAREGTIYYVWDILDTGGNRLHRINGQETVRGRVSADWTGVPASAMEALADRTVDELAAWLRTQSG